MGLWTVEEFGADVAVLRTAGGTATPHAHAADVLLSCSGADRRVRLLLPAPVTEPMSGGSALITPVDRSDQRPLVARFKFADTTTILMTSGTAASRDIAVAIGRMLLTKPRALDIVLSVGSGPVAFTKLKVVRLLLSLGPEDVVAVTRFVDACARFPAAQAN